MATRITPATECVTRVRNQPPTIPLTAYEFALAASQYLLPRVAMRDKIRGEDHLICQNGRTYIIVSVGTLGMLNL